MSSIEDISQGLGDAIVPGTTSTIKGLAIYRLVASAQRAKRFPLAYHKAKLRSLIGSQRTPEDCGLSGDKFEERKEYLVNLMSDKLWCLYQSYPRNSSLGMACKVEFTNTPTALYAAVAVSGRKNIVRGKSGRSQWRNNFSRTDFGIVSLGELAQSQSTEIGISAAPISAVWDQGTPTGGWDDRGGSSIKMEHPWSMMPSNHSFSGYSYWNNGPNQTPEWTINPEQRERALMSIPQESSVKPEQQQRDLNSIPLAPYIKEEPTDDDDNAMAVWGPVALERTDTYVKPEPKDDDDGTSYLDPWQSTQQPEPSTGPGTATGGLAASKDTEPDRRVVTEDPTLGSHDNGVDSEDIMAPLLEALDRQDKDDLLARQGLA